MNDKNRKTVQHVIGLLAALIFLVMAGVSMMAPYELTPAVIAGAIIVIAMLLGKLERIVDLVDSWRQ